MTKSNDNKVDKGKQENLRFDGVKFYAVHFDILGEPAENTDINLDVTPKVFPHSETKFDIVYDVELMIPDAFKIRESYTMLAKPPLLC